MSLLQKYDCMNSLKSTIQHLLTHLFTFLFILIRDFYFYCTLDWSRTSYYPGNNTNTRLLDSDVPMVLPLVMEHLCPKVVALFGLGAVAAAVMSSVDSQVLSASGMFARNVYKRLFRRNVSYNFQKMA